MTKELAAQRVEVTFVGPPPARQIARATGVTEVKVDGHLVRCLVWGSFQPFLEALHGYEVICMSSTPALSIGDES
ncbi:MAG: hypothetical protein QOJ33_329 [Chloroflexota bacterium]|nr:hypothetical protein [Chloroflexota bacterium]